MVKDVQKKTNDWSSVFEVGLLFGWVDFGLGVIFLFGSFVITRPSFDARAS